ncbi:MAG: hypothetical protein IKL47_04455 [Clostridia bacterium]|nr:hypothetical protein [Clostridia bacterium]
MPIAFAAQVTLSATNITIQPTATGTIYYGQTVDEAITLAGGEVQYNGVAVPGSFVHTDPDFRPLGAGANRETRASFTFIPTDDNLYSSIAVRNSRDVTYIVLPTTPVLADENDKPIVTEPVEAGTTLSNIAISGGKVQNPYYPEEATYLSQTWTWVDPTINVAESGYYEAKIVGDDKKYSDFVYSIYIEVLGSIVVPEIEAPTIELVYESTRIWADISLDSCKAFITNENGSKIEVEGSFSVADSWKNSGAYLGVHQIDVIFTPIDIETYSIVEFKLNVSINPSPISFKGDDGNFIVDGYEYEATPGVLMRDVLNSVKKYLNYPPQSVFVIEDANSAAQNGRTYKLTVIHDNPNYTGSELYFTVVFKNVELAPTIAFAGYNQYKVDCGRYSPAGTFTITCNGEEIAEAKAGQPFDCEVYTDEGGTYEITAKYNPTENDYFIVSDASYSITVNPARNIKTVSGMHFTVNGSQTYNAIRTGDVIELTYNMPEFAYYVVKDGSGKTVTLEGVDLTSKKIKFTMPDFDLSFSVKTPAQLEQEEATANCDHLCHSDNQFIQLIWKLLHFIFRLFNVQQYCDCGITHYDAPIFG